MNPLLKVSLCDRRTARRYKNQEKPWSWLKDKNRQPIRTTETAAEYPKLPKADRDALKDHGGFVGGWLREGIRKNGNVLCRTVGALDADNIPAPVNFPAIVHATLSGIEWFLYSTHKHTPEAPRFRLVILFDREVSEDEYPALMRQVAKDLGMDYFDDSTYEANRMMYWSSSPSDGQFVFEESEGVPLPVDAFLARYADWRDTAQWPMSSRESEVIRSAAKTQQNPTEKDGLIGAFCRAFPIQSAMEKFLPDVYAPTDSDGRWDYIPAESTAGVVVYDDCYVYSHHTSDPACGKLLNAFDLVRIHKFGDADTKKSFQLMCDFVQQQPEVKLQLDAERRARITEIGSTLVPGSGSAVDIRAGSAGPPTDGSTEPSRGSTRVSPPPDDRTWTTKLQYRPRTSELEKNAHNLMLILTNDPDFRNFAYNDMFHRVEVIGEVPWDRPAGNRFWRDADTAQLKVLLDTRYVAFSDRVLDACFTKVVEDRRFHPVRDYLNALPPWDGTKRIEFLFQRCFQAEDTPYTRAVARKVFTAAVARIMTPGIKFDGFLVLDGEQGIGKSSLFRELAGPEFYAETLSLTDMADKSAAEKLQGYWVVEIGELAGMRKADIEKVKAFLTTTDDTYRPSYGHVVESHPRQCIIIGTVNGVRGYLRDITGNRRYWIVKCRQKEPVKNFSFSKEERDQIWAEALHFRNKGEWLDLEKDLLEEANRIQRSSMEEDDRQGLIESYLDLLLPMNWPDMDLGERRMYLSSPNAPTRPKGVLRRETVSNAEIWTECFGKELAAMKKPDSLDIATMMMRVDGWERSDKREYLPLYGRQRLYVRSAPGETPAPVPLDTQDNGTTTSAEIFDFLR